MTREEHDHAIGLAMAATLCLIYTPTGQSTPALERFHTFQDMATRAERLRRRGLLQALGSCAFGRKGSRLCMDKLLTAGFKLCQADADHSKPWRWNHRISGYERRNGPVPGTACRRGGGGCFRRIRTFNEMKSAQPSGEFAEPAPRGARSASSIPDSRDDFLRSSSHSWKEHGKGRKAWSRKGREPHANRQGPSMDLGSDPLDDDLPLPLLNLLREGHDGEVSSI